MPNFFPTNLMRNASSLVAIVVSLVAMAPAMAWSVKKGAVTPTPSMDRAKKETAEAIEANKEYALLKKEEYESRLKKDLAEVDAQIVRMRERLKNEGKESREKLSEQLTKLEAERDSVRAEFKKLSKQSGKAWDDIRAGFQHAYEGLSKSVKSATSRFKD